MEGIKKWSRSTEPLKNSIFNSCRRGYSNRDAATESGISVATVERSFHQTVLHKISYLQNRLCPKCIGIDEHKFSKKVGFATTFCNLDKHSVFDITPGGSEKRAVALSEKP